jgi:hypothetical protein
MSGTLVHDSSSSSSSSWLKSIRQTQTGIEVYS